MKQMSSTTDAVVRIMEYIPQYKQLTKRLCSWSL